MKSLILPSLLLMTASVIAQETALTIDRAVTNSLQLSFPNDNNIKPKASDFNIVNYVLMSNEEGERWAVVTLHNTASGSRSFEQEHLMALFADGSRRSPLEYKLNFSGDEVQSMTLNFGENNFPILAIYASDK